MSRLFLSFTLIILTLGVSACNDNIGSEKKAELEGIFSTLIADQKAMFSEENGFALEIIGDLKIEENGSHYNVTMPQMIYSGPKQGRFYLDPVLVKATPTSKDGQWDMSVTLPNKMPILDENGEQISAIIIGTQDAKGLWDTDLKSFAEISATYENVDLLNKKGGVGASMETVIMVSDLKETSKNLWSGPSTFEIDNLKVGGDNSNVVIKQILSSVDVKNYSIEQNEEFLNKIKENPQMALAESFRSLGNNYSFAVQLNEMKVDTKESQKQGRIVPATKFILDQAYLNFSSKELTDKNVDQEFSFGYKDLKSETNNSLTPTDAALTMLFKNIPINQLTQMGEDINETTDTPQARKALTMQKIMGLPEILAAANSSIIIEETGVTNDIYNVSMEANIIPNTTSKFGAIGTIKITINGLEKTLEEINRRKETMSPLETRKMAGPIQVLTMVQVIGDKQDDKYILNFEATEDGKFLINGKDMSSLMAAGGL